MARKIFFALVSLVLVAPVMTPSASAAPPTLPEGYQKFIPNVDYAALMGETARPRQDLACTITSSNIAAFPVGSSFIPSELRNDLQDKGPKFVIALNNSSKEAVATCSVGVSMPAGTRSISGSIDNEALAEFLGTSTGSFTLDCEIQSVYTATANIRFGGKVPGRVDVVVTGADNDIPFDCAIAIAFGANTMNGTVKGSVSVVDPVTAGVCDGSTTITCVPIRMNDATVTISSSTGRFGGLTGTGTYSFVKWFSLPYIDEDMKAIPYVNVTASSVRTSSVHKASGASESMFLTLGQSATRTAIPRPITSKIATDERIYVTGAAKAACTLSVKVGRRSTTLAKFTLDAKGQVPATSYSRIAFTRKVARALRAKENSKVAVTATCQAGKKKATSAKRTLTYLG